MGAVFAAGLVIMYTASAVHDDGLFELDANTVDIGADPGDDWDSIYENHDGDAITVVLNPANFASTFSDDNNAATDGIDRTVWAEGSKDYNLMADNACTSKKNVGPNFDLEYTYTSFYDMGGDLWVAFGADRDAVNGTKGFGVWLAQEEMFCDPVTGDWTGERTIGDLLLVADYSNGGFVATIRGYLWDPTADNNLNLIFDSNTADCTLPSDGHHTASPFACMTVNGPRGAETGNITTPWRGDLIPGQFAEGAANITQIFELYGGGEEPCFNTVLTEYRASIEKTSALHDFSVENVNTCGKIIIEKSTDPDGATDDFSFDVEDSENVDIVTPFMLKDGQSEHITDVPPGTYAAYETDPSPVWALDNIICQDDYDEDAVPPAGVDGDSSTNGAATIVLSRNETVHCLFENVKQGKIIVDKVTVPAGDPQEFVFTPSYNGGATFNLADATTPNDSGYLMPGTYSVAETVPEGWDLTSATCDDGSSPASIGLAAGEVVTCTFTNTKRGKIIVDKVTDPSGDPTPFTFTPSYNGGATFQLADATTPNDSGYLVPGSYSVTETVPAGWDLTSATCDDGSAPSAIGLDPGEIVTCTFNNRARANIRILKLYTVAALFDGDVENFDFSFTPSGEAAQLFDLDATGQSLDGAIVPPTCTGGASDDDCEVFANVIPGVAHTIAEVDPTFPITFSEYQCSGSNYVAGGNVREVVITPDPGETVTCIYVNTRLQRPGNILIRKVLEGPTGTVASFDYERLGGTGPSATGGTGAKVILPFSLMAAAGDDINVVCPDTTVDTSLIDACHYIDTVDEGTYNIQEILANLGAQVFFKSLSCYEVQVPDESNNTQSSVAAGSNVANISIEDGETVVCTYVNEYVPGDEGCTPGFWKQDHHLGHWLPTGYLPDMLLVDVFDFTGAHSKVAALSGYTMLEALSFQGGNDPGGKAEILLRAAVAAVLNASHPDVDYAYGSAGDVIAAVNNALSSDPDVMLALATDLDNANNGVFIDNEGSDSCPLSGQLFLTN
ncbi:hypothetical protein GCM10011352_30390 [Marinobacterium zhoushanense]|uniref:SpaA-like prealbumin fold domain-containing protein n=2 Tax=Marinobacterium zhoushanense TaxID=1679163 RepID=A0ABQ1KJW4_9GAMM|nr:hypothetical protein GCM10011352_30390 [Marinobacterium zhoushanense]